MAVVSPLMDVFIQAEGYRSRHGSPIRFGVVHDMEAPETATMAEDLGRNWFARPRDRNGRRVYASTQYGVDNNSVVGYVTEDLAAYGANRVANNQGIHYEHAGYARQTSEEWVDEYGRAMLDRSARLAADHAARYFWPVRWLNATDLKAGRTGFTSHAECSKAWGGDHYDPGPNFPVDLWMQLVQRYFDDPAALPVLVPGDRDGKNSLGASAGTFGKSDGAASEMQARLVKLGHDLGPYGPNEDGVDGDPGTLTWAAVRRVRRENALSDEPICDEATWRVLSASVPLPPEPEPCVDVGPALAALEVAAAASKQTVLSVSEAIESLQGAQS